eukprot:65800_1
MVKCQHDDCTKGASFGIDEAMRCAAHRFPSDVYIKQKVLPTSRQHVPSGLNYNPVGETPQTTVHHISHEGEIICQDVGCTKGASYGFPGEPAQWCAKHKKSAAVFLRKTAANMSAVKAKAEHIPSGLVHHPDLESNPSKVTHVESHEHCQHTGCHKAPSYGFPGDQWSYCYSHKTSSMIYLKHAKTFEKKAAQQHIPSGLDIDHQHESKSHAKDYITKQKEINEQGHPGPPNEADIASPVPNMDAAQRAVCESKKNNEDPTFFIKIMSTILKKPMDFKYRRLRIGQHKFFSEVWLCPGLRAFCYALGFVNSKDGAWVALHPVTPESLPIIRNMLVFLACQTNHPSLVGSYL